MHEYFSLKELLEIRIYEVKNITSFTHDEYHKYQKLLSTFKLINSSDASTIDKGDVLEDLTTHIIKSTKVFNIYRNITTTSNEVDLFLCLNELGNVLVANGLLDVIFKNFICECKNYNKKIDVTWIGKFISLVKLCEFNFGIMFSYHGLTGRNPWSDAIGLTKKFYLKDKIIIIDMNITDLETLDSEHTFIDIINNKIMNIKHDLNIDQFLLTHPASDKL